MIPGSDSLERCRRIYAGDAAAYERLIAAEDCEGRLLPALESVAPLAGADVLDVGAGTGRLARLAAPRCGALTVTEIEPAMLREARRLLRANGDRGAAYAIADARALPLRPGSFDLVTAGWVFGHFTFWAGDRWREHADRAIREMARVARGGGTLVIFETMGTAVTSPAPPAAGLAGYYAWLEADMGFERRLLRTDFAFASVEASAAACGFFFGDAYADLIRANGWARVPEWTGMWWRRG